MSRRFGTDGIRDLAGKGALAPKALRALGRVLGGMARGRGVLIGRDTRVSGPAIEAALARGLSEAGAHVYLAGVLPTPAVARAVRGNHALGIVVSASHNPAEYNGVKVFDADGLKASPALEARIERALDTGRIPKACRNEGWILPDLAMSGAVYGIFLRLHLPRSLKGWTIAVDCAHGAASRIFPRCLARAGAKVISLGDRPDGANINRRCGATSPEALVRAVRHRKADLGVAFDGDADRVLFVDEKGAVHDGDTVLYVMARDLKARRLWAKHTVVATEVSNLGLDRAIRALGGRVVRTAVGDRNVVEAMRKGGFVLGGETSGHTLLPQSECIGDGPLTAAAMISVLARSGKPLSVLARGMVRFPSVSRNLKVSVKPEIASVPLLAGAIREGRRVLGKEGRLVVRYSGTEPLLRILAEGPDRNELESVVGAIADAARVLA